MVRHKSAMVALSASFLSLVAERPPITEHCLVAGGRPAVVR